MPQKTWSERVEVCLYASLFVFGLLSSIKSSALRDFGSFFESGKAAGGGQNPYAVYPLTFHMVSPGFEGFNRNLNPPTLLPLFELFSRLAPESAVQMWRGVSITACLALLTILLRAHRDQVDHRLILWFLALGGIWDTVHLGQIYLPLAVLSAGAWLLLNERREAAAGLFIGVLAALKPNFLVWPVLLLIAGYYRPALTAMVASLSIILSSLALYGPVVYAEWLQLLESNAAGAGFPTNGSLIGAFARLGVPAMGQAASVGLLVAAAVWAWRRRPPALVVSAVALVASVLASPLGWAHYGLFLLPILVSQWKDRGPPVSISAALLATPPILMARTNFEAWWLLATVGSLYTWAFIGIGYVALKMDTSRRATSDLPT